MIVRVALSQESAKMLVILRREVLTHPRTGIADVQMVPPLLGRELGPGLLGDEVAERALLALELARLVARLHPVGDLVYC
jgi:hypothetical protein